MFTQNLHLNLYDSINHNYQNMEETKMSFSK